MNRSARSPFPSSLLTDLLEALGESKVSQDPLDLAAVAPDASHYLLTPSVLVRAGSTSDVAAAMAAAKRHKVAVNFRSGGTSLSGQGLTNGVMVDARRSFRGIEVLDGGRKVRVQPRATIVAVNSVLARYGRKLGPDRRVSGMHPRRSAGRQLLGYELRHRRQFLPHPRLHDLRVGIRHRH
ncbi:D-lactate dehydrogenase [Cutibacterium acnes JCM 18918]|nr:D-lactate dehydrogenase [Cutibacterium acnes JCM 18918]